MTRRGNRPASKATPENHAEVAQLPAQPPLIITVVHVPVQPSMPRPLLAICNQHQGSRAAASRLDAAWQRSRSSGSFVVCTSGDLGPGNTTRSHVALLFLVITLLGMFASLAAC